LIIQKVLQKFQEKSLRNSINVSIPKINHEKKKELLPNIKKLRFVDPMKKIIPVLGKSLIRVFYYVFIFIL